MINFIRAHGNERIAEIKQQSEHDFTVGKEKMIEAERKRLTDQFKKDINIAEVNMKIERSAELNKTRINKMRKTNELVESLQFEAKVKMASELKARPENYKTLLKDLLI